MGTEITLDVAGISICWSKNSMGIDFGALFQPEDDTRRRSDQLNYEYADENSSDEEIALREAAFCRPLWRVVPRLNLLGHTLASARVEYQAVVEEATRTHAYTHDTPADFMSFDEFCAYACRCPLPELDGTVDHEDKDKPQARFPDDKRLFHRVPGVEGTDFFWSERSYYGATTCILGPYSMLQAFATAQANREAEVMWQYGPVVDSGWVEQESFRAGPDRTETTLIATEGSSDIHILKHALKLLAPDIADFFRFIDVNERHPFSGTGNLFKFAEGLVRIDVQNQVIVLLDNDAEGLDAYRKMVALGLPPNMRATLLPDHDAFRSFPARGPEGISESDINGRAAAIECYLDLRLEGRPQAQVLWSNFKKDVDAWQGALEHKESYVEPFLKLNAKDVSAGKYDVTKIGAILRHITAEATIIAETGRGDRALGM